MNRLLTKEEFFQLHERFFGEGSGTCCEIDDTDLCFHVAQAQNIKTAQDIVNKIETFAEGEGHYWALEKLVQSDFWRRLKEGK